MYSLEHDGYVCDVCGAMEDEDHYDEETAEYRIYWRSGDEDEDDEKCDVCGLYHSTFSYGQATLRHGFVTEAWAHPDETPDYRPAMEEARRLWAETAYRTEWKEEVTARAKGAVTDLYEDDTFWLVFADWLEDKNLPTQAGAVRDAVKRAGLARERDLA